MSRAHAIKYDQVYEMNIIHKIAELHKNHKRNKQLKLFDEVEPNVFVLKHEIVNRLSLKINKMRKRKPKKRNHK